MSSTELEALSNRVDNEIFEGVQYMVRYNQWLTSRVRSSFPSFSDKFGSLGLPRAETLPSQTNKPLIATVQYRLIFYDLR